MSQYNDLFYKFWGSEGYTGAYNDRAAKWLRAFFPEDAPWLLVGGVWNDLGTWQDNEIWVD